MKQLWALLASRTVRYFRPADKHTFHAHVAAACVPGVSSTVAAKTACRRRLTFRACRQALAS